ncbi:MAG: NAD(P)-dependent dehydrogenase (short-subunit alcohol dehydrogenase family) [Verrucomicrobiales bacterium]
MLGKDDVITHGQKMNNPKRFDGQVALVTGGSDGIGQHIAQRLRSEGAAVIVMDVQEGTQLQQMAFQKGDVSVEADVIAAMDSAIQQHGRLDIVVHCAGIVGQNSTKITEVSAESFDKVYAVNLRGSFLVTKHALKRMANRDYGRILLFASIAGKEGNAGMCAYSATKAGVIGLTKSAGKEFAESGITVNAIAPAVIHTAMVEALDPWQVTYMTDKIPMKRCGTLDEVTALSCWIVSPEASFNTGAVFDLTGGRATY